MMIATTLSDADPLLLVLEVILMDNDDDHFDDDDDDDDQLFIYHHNCLQLDIIYDSYVLSLAEIPTIQSDARIDNAFIRSMGVRGDDSIIHAAIQLFLTSECSTACGGNSIWREPLHDDSFLSTKSSSSSDSLQDDYDIDADDEYDSDDAEEEGKEDSTLVPSSSHRIEVAYCSFNQRCHSSDVTSFHHLHVYH